MEDGNNQMEIMHWEIDKISSKWVNLRYVTKATWNTPFCEGLPRVNYHTRYLRRATVSMQKLYHCAWRLLQRWGFIAQDWCTDTTLKTSVSHNFQFREVGREIKGVARGWAVAQLGAEATLGVMTGTAKVTRMSRDLQALTLLPRTVLY